ncbi:hypothetical protein [Nannocystis punicea]|uniref:Uncharacterized protein n=1 Tax=Nannocystis punicea TaxID=2995304 RepID=A0ABY7GZI7_9BACT|nr:hypothetical protein [Nannocystis poenicansa]WAS92343.1 hypothetical protein O0S08_39700 [Nannocystis poenicansa]
MSTRMTLVRSTRPLIASFVPVTLPDGLLTVRYGASGSLPVFECAGQRVTGGLINLSRETWIAWQDRGIDLVVEPGAPNPARTVRVTATSGRNLLTTAGDAVPLVATARLGARLLFDGDAGMSLKIALDGLGAVEIDLCDVSSHIRPPPPKLPPDAPKPN